jgi:hypothetical protein
MPASSVKKRWGNAQHRWTTQLASSGMCACEGGQLAQAYVGFQPSMDQGLGRSWRQLAFVSLRLLQCMPPPAENIAPPPHLQTMGAWVELMLQAGVPKILILLVTLLACTENLSQQARAFPKDQCNDVCWIGSCSLVGMAPADASAPRLFVPSLPARLTLMDWSYLLGAGA